MGTRIWIGFAFIVLWLGAASAGADERRLILSLGVSEEYNDNIFLTFDDEVDDYINRLLGGLRLTNRTERLDLAISGEVENIHYNDNDELDGLDQHYAGSIGYAPAPEWELGLDGAYSKDSQPDRDIDVTGLALGTATRETHEYGLGIQHELSEITSTSLSYRYRQQQYDSDRFVDYDSHTAGLGLSRRLDRYWNHTTGRLNVNYAQYDYDTTRIDYYSGTLGVLWQFSELWHLQVEGGGRYAESEFDLRGETETNNGWGSVGSLKFGYRGEYAAVTLTASHDIGPASGRDGSVERTSGIVDFSYRFAEKAWAGISAGYYLNKTDQGDLATSEIDENTVSLRPFVRIGLIDMLVLEATYAYLQIEDKVFEDTVERNVYLLKLVLNYPIME